MLKWLLITAITLVSATLLMFVSAYIAIFAETAAFYQTSVSNVIFLSNTFNIFYLIISPFIFPFLKRRYYIIVQIAIALIAIGCLGRYFAGTNYSSSLIFSILVAIAHVPIITAPYGLLGLFQPSKRGYASSIPLFVPILGINFCILYGMSYIAGQLPSGGARDHYIQKLNGIIALVGVISSCFALVLLNVLKRQVKAINDNSQQAQNTKNIFSSLKNQFRGIKEFLIVAASWGTILGLNWTYGGMFGIFLDGTGLSHKEIALVGLYANLSSAVFCNLGNWISNRFQFSNSSIIFFLNIFGFLGSLFIQASSALPQPIFHDKTALIIAVIVLRAGFSSFVSLALIQLNQFGPSVLVSSVFFYVANATNLGGIYLVDRLSNPKSLAIMSSAIWTCIFLVHVVHKGKVSYPVGSIELSSEEQMKKSDVSDTQMQEKKDDNDLEMQAKA